MPVSVLVWVSAGWLLAIVVFLFGFWIGRAFGVSAGDLR